MIRISDEIALEKLLRDTRFTDEIHKQRLMQRLRDEADASDELSEDDLAMAAGGTKQPEGDSPSRRPR